MNKVLRLTCPAAPVRSQVLVVMAYSMVSTTRKRALPFIIRS
jgi:hypothetical protein